MQGFTTRTPGKLLLFILSALTEFLTSTLDASLYITPTVKPCTFDEIIPGAIIIFVGGNVGSPNNDLNELIGLTFPNLIHFFVINVLISTCRQLNERLLSTLEDLHARNGVCHVTHHVRYETKRTSRHRDVIEVSLFPRNLWILRQRKLINEENAMYFKSAYLPLPYV